MEPTAARRLTSVHSVHRIFAIAAALLLLSVIPAYAQSQARVILPNYNLVPIGEQGSLEAGANVLVEKPIAMNVKEAMLMAGTAKKVGRKLMTAQHMRFESGHEKLREVVDRGDLGRIYHATAACMRRRGIPGWGKFHMQKESRGGPLIDIGVHVLDAVMWIMGFPKPLAVSGKVARMFGDRKDLVNGEWGTAYDRTEFDVEDFAVGLVKFDNGATLEIEASWAGNIAEQELMQTRLLGTKAGLLQHNVNGTYEFEAKLYQERDGAQYDMELRPPVPGVESAQAHFVNALLADTPHIATGEEGLIVMELLDAIYESARLGEPVKINR